MIAANEPASTLLSRIAFLSRHMPRDNWPGFDDGGFDELLRDACAGRRSIDEVIPAGIIGAIQRACRIRWIGYSTNMRQRRSSYQPETEFA